MQVKKNIQSKEMQTDDLIKWLLERGVREGSIKLFDTDLGVSGTKGINERTGMQELVDYIKRGKIRAVLVYNISRLFRDETGVQYNTFAQICK
jgi:DNA invertase Pin-like site-specific DNA recombinase